MRLFKTQNILLTVFVLMTGITGCQKPKVDRITESPIALDEDGRSIDTWELQTTQGNIPIKLFGKAAPTHCKRFLELVEAGFYKNLLFFHIEPGKLIQTGDPENTGLGGSGKLIPAEFNRLPHLEGAVGFARQKKPDTADSQFYITLVPLHALDLQYTIFATAIGGLDVTRKITKTDRLIQITKLSSKK